MLIPIVIAAVSLGRAFNIITGSTTIFIYDPPEIKKNVISIKKSFVKSQYRFLESSEDVNNFLNVDGDLSIKAKNGDIGLQGVGMYLKESIDRERTVEMLIESYHETETHTFPSYLPVRNDWQNKPQTSVGTHYIRSITYGGRLIISYQLRANKKEYMEHIKGAVNANLQLSGSLDLNVTGNLEKLSQEVSQYSSVKIMAFATTGIFNQPENVEQIFDLVDKYPEMVQEVNNGLGSPLQLEIVPISTIQPNYTDYVKDRALDGVLGSATDKLDDLRAVMEQFANWYKQAFNNMTDEQLDKADEFSQRLKSANKAMKLAISNLDSTKGPEQFDAAFKAYGEGPENVPNKYSREFLKLQNEVGNIPFHWFLYTKAMTHYIRWGSTTCSLPTTVPLYVGYAALSNGFGNGATPQCLPARDPGLEIKNLGGKVAKSVINGVAYDLPEKSGQVFCSFCVLQNATSTFVVPGRTDCPSESKLEYEGYLMVGTSPVVSHPICLDKHPVDEIPGEDKTKVDKGATTLIPAWIECPECEGTKQKFLPCVVCSR